MSILHACRYLKSLLLLFVTSPIYSPTLHSPLSFFLLHHFAFSCVFVHLLVLSLFFPYSPPVFILLSSHVFTNSVPQHYFVNKCHISHTLLLLTYFLSHLSTLVSVYLYVRSTVCLSVCLSVLSSLALCYSCSMNVSLPQNPSMSQAV